MAWFIGIAIVFVFGVFLAGYRKLALSLVAVALIGGFLLYQYNERLQERAATRIAASEIVIENIAFRRTYRSSYDVTGRIKNDSQTYTLHGISLDVTMRDCLSKEQSSCVVIGEATTYAAIVVPPQEARDFIASLYFGGDPVKVKGKLVWDYKVTEISAKRQ